MTQATQIERVLAASRRFNGVCQHDFNLPETCDGGKPISRVAARIEELETRRACVFEILPKRKGFRVYRLVSEPDVGRASSSLSTPSERYGSCLSAGGSPSAEPETLFTPPARPHWQDEAA